MNNLNFRKDPLTSFPAVIFHLSGSWVVSTESYVDAGWVQIAFFLKMPALYYYLPTEQQGPSSREAF